MTSIPKLLELTTLADVCDLRNASDLQRMYKVDINRKIKGYGKSTVDKQKD